MVEQVPFLQIGGCKAKSSVDPSPQPGCLGSVQRLFAEMWSTLRGGALDRVLVFLFLFVYTSPFGPIVAEFPAGVRVEGGDTGSAF